MDQDPEMGHGHSWVNQTGSQWCEACPEFALCLIKLKNWWSRQTHAMTLLVSITFDCPQGGMGTETEGGKGRQTECRQMCFCQNM